MLAGNPQLGHKRDDLTRKAVRFWSVYAYLVIYDPRIQPLHILRVLSGYRDIGTILEVDP
jgi:antitoxin ParD1/3/4/toxin ParE1/3/4